VPAKQGSLHHQKFFEVHTGLQFAQSFQPSVYIQLYNKTVQATTKSYRIMRMNMFAVQDKAKPDKENMKGLNLAVVKLTTVQMTKLLL
jgi:hypothetical protein